MRRGLTRQLKWVAQGFVGLFWSNFLKGGDEMILMNQHHDIQESEILIKLRKQRE